MRLLFLTISRNLSPSPFRIRFSSPSQTGHLPLPAPLDSFLCPNLSSGVIPWPNSLGARSAYAHRHLSGPEMKPSQRANLPLLPWEVVRLLAVSRPATPTAIMRYVFRAHTLKCALNLDPTHSPSTSFRCSTHLQLLLTTCLYRELSRLQTNKRPFFCNRSSKLQIWMSVARSSTLYAHAVLR